MRTHIGLGTIAGAAASLAIATMVALQAPLTALATVGPIQLSSDNYRNSTSQHHTQVEPDTFSYGSTIVMAIQTGRFFDGGASNIAWAASTDGGTTWHKGYLPGTTIYATPKGTWARVSDPSVAYDAKHHVWLISMLPLGASVSGFGSAVSRSTDGGLTWSNPVQVQTQSGTDKDWIVCDDTSTSPHYGNCYQEWDLNSAGNVIYMSTSSDGGATWGTPRTTANNATGIGGQPLVQPNGTVVVPIDDANESNLLAFRSTDGGATWSATRTVTRLISAFDPGNLRSGPLPTAEIDGAGKVYVVWEDCRFETGCASNDLVVTTSSDGLAWSAVARIPIGSTGSGADYLLPGLAVDPATSGAGAHLGLVYYTFPNVNCSVSTCQLNVAFVSSTNGGSTWSTPTPVAGPMKLSWLPNTTGGLMVGDYMSTSFVGGAAYPGFALAKANKGAVFHEALNTASGLAVDGGTQSSAGDVAVTTTSSRPALTAPARIN